MSDQSVESTAARLNARNVRRELFAALMAQPAGAIGFTLTALIVLAAVLAPLLSPWPPLETHYADALKGPGAKYWLGTDDVGRDVLSRVLYGARPALLVAVTAVLSGGSFGTALGIAAGYYRGAVEVVVMRICDIAFAFPLILVGVCTVIILGPSILSVGVAVGIGVFPMFARLARAEVLEEMQRDFVIAARGMGASDLYIARKHLVPNISATIVVQLATTVSGAIIIASALDFLGIGAQPPMPSWGNMLQSSRLFLAQQPTFALAPGLALTAFVIGINMFAAALTNALDPRIRTEILKGRAK
jgi:peptide/nickel transport system permease protein